MEYALLEARLGVNPYDYVRGVSEFKDKPFKVYRNFTSNLAKQPKYQVPLWFQNKNNKTSLKLTPSQEYVLNKVKSHTITRSQNEKLRLIIHSSAGHGKSYLIGKITELLNLYGKKSVTTVCTGVSALSVSGITLHSFMGLPLYSDFNIERKRANVSVRFASSVERLSYLIIDECSFVDISFFEFISNSICKARKNADPFGNLDGVILTGDFGQLPPVLGLPLWKDPSLLFGNAQSGANLFRSFEICELKEVTRQSDDLIFYGLLQRFRHFQLTDHDISHLRSRQLQNLNAVDREKFSSSLHIFQRNAEVHRHNLTKLLELYLPICRIIPHQRPKFPLIAKCEHLFLSYTAPVVLTRNVSVPHGLVNEREGIFHSILYRRNSKINHSLPICVFVSFSGYTGSLCITKNATRELCCRESCETVKFPSNWGQRN
jgi:hypothetical protein